MAEISLTFLLYFFFSFGLCASVLWCCNSLRGKVSTMGKRACQIFWFYSAILCSTILCVTMSSLHKWSSFLCILLSANAFPDSPTSHCYCVKVVTRNWRIAFEDLKLPLGVYYFYCLSFMANLLIRQARLSFPLLKLISLNYFLIRGKEAIFNGRPHSLFVENTSQYYYWE